MPASTIAWHRLSSLPLPFVLARPAPAPASLPLPPLSSRLAGGIADSAITQHITWLLVLGYGDIYERLREDYERITRGDLDSCGELRRIAISLWDGLRLIGSRTGVCGRPEPSNRLLRSLRGCSVVDLGAWLGRRNCQRMASAGPAVRREGNWIGRIGAWWGVRGGDLTGIEWGFGGYLTGEWLYFREFGINLFGFANILFTRDVLLVRLMWPQKPATQNRSSFNDCTGLPERRND